MKLGLEILSNVIKNGKVSDATLDICKNSSLPTLSLNLLRNLCRSDILGDIQELVKELLHVISELSKIFFTKVAGIDPLFQRAIVPVLVQLFRQTDLQIIHLASLKCLGSFVSQACIVPIRSQNLYRDLVD